MLPYTLRAHTVLSLDDGWDLATTAAGAARPGDDQWEPIGERTTVAGAWRRLGRWSLDDCAFVDFDAHDHWFRVQVDVPTVGSGDRVMLELDGIATIGDVFVDGAHLASSTSMFVPLRIDVTDRFAAGPHQVEIRCASLTTHLAGLRLPRAAWRTRLVSDAKLRGVRTTLLGRIPSWSPPVSVVGPWRPVRVRIERGLHVDAISAVQRGGHLQLTVRGSGAVSRAVAFVGAAWSQLSIEGDGNACVLHGDVPLTSLAPWWPHTHGAPVRHDVRVELSFADGTRDVMELRRTGVCCISVDRGHDGRDFALRVNGTPVFCRGAVVMPIDPATLSATREQITRLLTQLRDAGCNMVRVSGTCAYEQDEFFDVCDELGMLVWHDLAFANLDYPSDDAFTSIVEQEIRSFLGRTSLSPGLAVVCGGSEVEQQAAMTGAAADVLETTIGRRLGPLVAEHAAVVYVASSPSGGHVPFRVDEGVSHYFGVGAYRRPLADADTAGVRFAGECLAFANVPSPAAVRELLADGETAPTSPRWKAGVPRDRDTGWDFDDVRDHYVAELFGIDVTDLRFHDPARYLAVARATSAELMARAFAAWRSPRSSCNGALVWCANDLRPGAGWGLVDSALRAKAALHGLAGVLSPVALLAIDEGMNGLDLWVVNDTEHAITGTLHVTAWRDGETRTASGSATVEAPARGAACRAADEVLGHFTDPTYAYRFGPPTHDAITARVVDGSGDVVARALFVRPGVRLEQDRSLGLEVCAEWIDASRLRLGVRAQRLARHVSFDIDGMTADREHFHVAPDDPRCVVAKLMPGHGAPRRGFASALNGRGEIAFTIPEHPS